MRWVFKWTNDESNSSWIGLKCFQVSNSCLMDLGSFAAGIVWPQASQACCDIPPSFGKDIPRLNLLSIFLGGDGGGERSWWKKIYSSWLIGWIKCIIISRRVGRLLAVEGAHVHCGRRYWGQFWRLRWLWAIVVIIGLLSVVCDCHRCHDAEKIGRQVKVI